jgi:integrase
LIQGGASVTYVKEQMGHSSIQVTVDTYGHLIPGANVNWVDRLDIKPELQQTATAQAGRVGFTRGEQKAFLKMLLLSS